METLWDLTLAFGQVALFIIAFLAALVLVGLFMLVLIAGFAEVYRFVREFGKDDDEDGE